MKDIVFKFADNVDDWKLTIIDSLQKASITYDNIMLNNMCNSLNTAILRYLTKVGYRPNKTQSYRLGLLKRLSKYGLGVKMTTNNIFWKYLEYFTDVEDYSKCFNIEILIVNVEKATKDLIFVGVKTNKDNLEIKQPTYSEDYAKITEKLDLVKVMADKCLDPKVLKDTIMEIINILDYLIGRTD